VGNDDDDVGGGNDVRTERVLQPFFIEMAAIRQAAAALLRARQHQARLQAELEKYYKEEEIKKLKKWATAQNSCGNLNNLFKAGPVETT